MQPDWQYQGKPLVQAPAEYEGFVYLITNTTVNKKYIGQKLFWVTRKLPPLAGKKQRRHKRLETDWKDYWGSSTALAKDVAAQGLQDFRREILYLCKNKNQMNYLEAQEQFSRSVLMDHSYYNGIINCRVTAKGL